MAGRKRTASQRNAGASTSTNFSPRTTRSRRSAATASSAAAAIPDVYRDMLVAAEITPTSPERPLKKRRPPGTKRLEQVEAAEVKSVETAETSRRRQASPSRQNVEASIAKSSPKEAAVQNGAVDASEGDEDDDDDDDDDDEELEFEDVALPTPTMQTMERDSDEEDEDEEEEEQIQLDNMDFSAMALGDMKKEEPKVLELDLAAARSQDRRKQIERRKPITRDEKDRRIIVHKMHLLCLLAHVARRNRWCNDSTTQKNLRPLLSSRIVKYLNPSFELTQFGRTNSLKQGLEDLMTRFKTRYKVTERGMRRALWAEKEEHLKNYELPEDIESPPEKQDFRDMARSLEGSRDIGAQLFCALLRSAGVEARLVCSLQPLACTPGAPPMGKPPKGRAKLSLAEQYARIPKYDSSFDSPATAPSPLSARRRLGHPNAAAFNAPMNTGPTTATAPAAVKKIKESAFPIYWVEILDEAHQKWQPVDPLVTESFWKPQKLEPPANDRENCMTYVAAFEADGTVRDVTRRYAKAYNAKTRKMRVESVGDRGEKWWRKALRGFSGRDEITDMDQIEANELNAFESREPMPRNVADFKDHPVYALERHLRQKEVLIPGANAAGTVGAGSTGKLEKVYRRRDVRIARTRDKWYRGFGREVREDEIPVKFVPRRAKKDDLFGDEDEDADPVLGEDGIVGNPLYTVEQTELYQAPPVVDGVVPKNKFGNLDVYVPSMVPKGGAYVPDDYGARAAFLLGVDYAPALTGFQFRGRQGTAVLQGVVVPQEAEEAVRAVVEGLHDEEAEFAREMRSREVLRAWKRMLMNLRVRQRIWAGVDSDEEGDQMEADESHGGDGDGQDEEEDDTQGGFSKEVPAQDAEAEMGGGFVSHDDDGGGGFMVDDDDDDDDGGGGGFVIDDDYAGGF